MASPVPEDNDNGEHEHHKKKRHINLTRDLVIKRLNRRNAQQEKPSPMVQLQEIFEEAEDKSRFVGDTMFWKYFEDISVPRIYHTDSAEYRNLWMMFWETLFYIVLVVIFTCYVYALSPRDTFTARQQQQDYWSGCVGSDVCRINKVKDIDSFWHFMRDDLLGLAFTEYEDPPPPVANILTTFPANDFPMIWNPRYIGPQRSDVALGTIRVRQLRVEKNTGCQVSKLYSHLFPECYAPYSYASRSEWSYMPRFAPTYLEDSYVYQPSSETVQAPISGSMGDYGGDGFTFNLPWDSSDSRVMISDLWEWSWVDQATRAVVVEVSVLNTNVNVVINSRYLFEFGPTGLVSGQVQSEATPVLFLAPSFANNSATLVFVFMILLMFMVTCFMGYVIFLIYKTIKNFVGENPMKYLKKQSIWGKLAFPFRTCYHYAQYVWNLVDLLFLVCYAIHLGLRLNIYTIVSTYDVMSPGSIGHPEKFMPFSVIFSKQKLCNQFLSVLALLIWAKAFKYLCIFSCFRLLVHILEGCLKKLSIFAALLICIFFGFSVALFAGMGGSKELYASLSDSFLVGFFCLIDGFGIDNAWFEPGASWILPTVYFVYIALIYCVIMNIAAAVVIDTYATADRSVKEDPNRKNPMAVFLYVYYKMWLGISLIRDSAEENMRAEDLSITLELLPGVVRRKWIEKKRKMQQIANENFAGMDLYPVEADSEFRTSTASDWMLPSSRTDVFDAMGSGFSTRPVDLYHISQAMLKGEVSRAQLQRMMDEDHSLPILLQEDKAENVIRRFKKEADMPMAIEGASPVKKLQGQIFGQLDSMERVKLDGETPEVKEVLELSADMNDAISSLRNQFRSQLTGIIEATAVLFEHLVEVTQGLDSVRENHVAVLDRIRDKDAERSLAYTR